MPSGRPLDGRTPILIGGGQINRRDEDAPAEPVELAARAARAAAADTAALDPAGLVTAIDTVSVVQIFSWHYRDPAALIAAALGAEPRRRLATGPGGNLPLSLVHRACQDIIAGEADLVLVGGAEAWRTRTATRKAGQQPDWTEQDEGAEPTEQVGGDQSLLHPVEVELGMVMPTQIYPLFESALRAEAGADHDRWAAHLGRLWARFAAVAAQNPAARIRSGPSAKEIATPGPANRMVGFPYPKLMNANNAVEQGAGVLVSSVERARAAGIPEERWVFPWAGAEANDTMAVSHRPTLAGSPAIAACGRALGKLTGRDPATADHVDLYSCFPSAVQVAAAELGLSLERPLTVTGGLSFAGGPWNNYVTHSLATMCRVLRRDPGSLGLISANGGYLTKHALGLFSTDPPPGGFSWTSAQAEADAAGSVDLDAEHTGPVTIEAAVVTHGRDGAPERAIAALRTHAGARTWGTSHDSDLLEAFETTEPVGRPGRREPDGTMVLTD